MRPDLDAALVRDFPRLFRDRHGDTRDTRMCDGFACGDGWEPIIRRLSEKLEPIARETGLRAIQVKEKFGDLRVYVRSADGARKLPAAISETVRATIGAAEKESRRTCEHCGAVGSTQKVEGWWSTLCDACLERERTRRAERKRHRREGPVAMTGTRVWLDDVRPAPEGWTRAYTAREAVALLEAGGVEAVSLDHDLGNAGTCGSGYDVVSWIEEQVALHGFEPPAIRIHSANVVGRARMKQAIASIERLRGTPASGAVAQPQAAKPDRRSEDRYKPLLDRRVPRDAIVLGHAYVIHARNGGVGVAVEEDGVLGYQLHREKFGDHYLFVEYDWDDDPTVGTAIPLRLIEAGPPTGDEELLAWLANQQEEHRTETDAAWEVVLGFPPSRLRGSKGP